MSKRHDAKGRSTGRRKRKTEIGGQFSWRLVEMQESPAYRTLSLSGHRILDRLEIELAAHGGTDNGKLPCTFDHFEEYGVHRHAIAPAIREVVALGFVEVTERGRAGNAEWRRPSVYRLTYRHTENANATDEWRKIATDQEAQALAIAARKAKPEKKSQCRKPHHTSVRKPHRSEAIHSADSTTTGHSADSTTTSRSWDVPATDTGQAQASGHSKASEAKRVGEVISLDKLKSSIRPAKADSRLKERP